MYPFSRPRIFTETILNIKHGIWSGFKVNYTRNVSRNVQASHSFTYGSTDEHQPDVRQAKVFLLSKRIEAK